MFRELRRKDKELSRETCIELLKNSKRAAFSVNGDDGYPFTCPIDYVYDDKDGKIYFHGSQKGHKVDALKKDNKICFTVWGGDYKTEGHWEWNVLSVVAFGRCTLMEPGEKAFQELMALAEKYYPADYFAGKHYDASVFQRVQMFCVEIDHMCGKDVNEK